MAPEGWTEKTVGELCDDGVASTQTGPFGSQLHSYDYVASGVPVIPTEAIGRRKLDCDDVPQVNDATAERLRRHRLRAGDILFARRGVQATGLSALVEPRLAGALCGTGAILLRVESEDIDSQFLSFYLSADESIQWLKQHAVGAVMPNLNESIIRGLPLLIPPLPEQKRIAHILGTLDDKIELNRRMNATLEAMSRAIFKSWFVDCDPVRQKAAGRQPVGMDAKTAALFPDSFEDSGIGEVPKGWGVDCFADHFDADRGLSYKGEGLREDGSGLPMHNLNSIYEGGGYKHEGIKYYAGEYRDKHLIAHGDVIVTNTEQGFEHLLIGHAAIVPACFGETGLYSHHIYRVRCKSSSPLTPHYVVALLNDPRWHHWISGFSNGTTINMLPLDALQMPLLVVPPPRLAQAFNQLATSTFEQCEANLEQSSRLAALRDTLLPKLLSGELRIPEAEQAVEEATA